MSIGHVNQIQSTLKHCLIKGENTMKELKAKGYFGKHCNLCINVGTGGGSDND